MLSRLALQVADLYLIEQYPEPATVIALPPSLAIPTSDLDEWVGFYRSDKTGCPLELAVEAEEPVIILEGDRIPLVRIDNLKFKIADQASGDWVVILEPRTTGRKRMHRNNLRCRKTRNLYQAASARQDI